MEERSHGKMASSNPWLKNAQYFTTVPQHCEPELCRLSDWHLHSARERFSSSSFADSESEEEMSKRMANKGLMGPPPTPPKVRRSGAAGGGVHDQRQSTLADKRRSQLMAVSRSSRLPQYSHSSSDDEVFFDSMPSRCRPLPRSILQHPPSLPDKFAVSHSQRDLPSQQQRHQLQTRNKEGTGFSERQQIRERRHSVPSKGYDVRGRGLSKGHAVSRGYSSQARDSSPSQVHSTGRNLSRGRSIYHETLSADSHSLPPSSAESSDDASFHQVISSADEFEYLSRYGYQNRRGLSRESRPSSRIPSGLSYPSGRHTYGRRGSSLPGQKMGQVTNRAGVFSDMPSSEKPGVMSRVQPAPNNSRNMPPAGPALGQGVMRHQPLPTPRPSNRLHLQQLTQSIHSLANVESRQHAVNTKEMSIAEKLHRFMLFVRHENSTRVNDIQTIENAITGCHLDLKTHYEVEDVGLYQGRHTYSGKLSLSGVFLARAVGQVKRELKHESYKLALQVLRTKTVAEILKQHDIGIEAIREKFEECSAANAETAVSEAVVNLASAAPIAVAMETVATMGERWQDFTTYLKGLNPDVGNTISRIELAISGSRCGLERHYTDSTIMDPVQGKPGFQGSLTIGGVLCAQGQGTKKKEAKQKTYDQAYSRFTTLEVADLLKGVEPQNIEEFKKEKSVPVVVKEIRTAEHIKKFELFIDRIRDSSVREGPITLLDLTANQLQLLITCMYKKLEEQNGTISLCQLFVGDILISEGEGRHKKEAQADAYSKAYDILISTPVETLTAESHRLNQSELQSADVQDVVIKGQVKKEESNLPRLRQQFLNVDEALSDKGSEEMVVVEHQEWVADRKRHAFCILHNSAVMNIMLLKWNTEIETGFFTCRVHIQGEELGMAKAHSRQQARNLASADALFKLYEKNPVLRIINSDPSEGWVTRAQLEERVKTMADSDFKDVDEEWQDFLLKRATKTDGEESAGGPVELTQEQIDEGKMERRLRVVAMKMLEEFQQQGDVLDELVFAPDLPCSVRRQLSSAVNRLGLRLTQCQKDGKIYQTLQFRVRVDKVVAAMKDRGITTTSRFLLVEDRSNLPCHTDIAEDIEVARTLTRQDRYATRTASKLTDMQSGDTVTGNSLNGSLFEETTEGFVTAQSYMITEASTSAQAPRVPSSLQTTPTKTCSPPKKQTTPAEEVYTKFARAMMASGIGQTLIPMECSTPVSSNILVNPPRSTLSVVGGAPVIKNILISPPKASSSNVTLTSPVKNLSTSSSASSSFPQPDFSPSKTPPPRCVPMQVNDCQYNRSQRSPTSSASACGSRSTSGHTHGSLAASVPQQPKHWGQGSVVISQNRFDRQLPPSHHTPCVRQTPPSPHAPCVRQQTPPSPHAPCVRQTPPSPHAPCVRQTPPSPHAPCVRQQTPPSPHAPCVRQQTPPSPHATYVRQQTPPSPHAPCVKQHIPPSPHAYSVKQQTPSPHGRSVRQQALPFPLAPYVKQQTPPSPHPPSVKLQAPPPPQAPSVKQQRPGRHNLPPPPPPPFPVGHLIDFPSQKHVCGTSQKIQVTTQSTAQAAYPDFDYDYPESYDNAEYHGVLDCQEDNDMWQKSERQSKDKTDQHSEWQSRDKNWQLPQWHSKDKNLQQSEWQSKDKNLQQHWHSKDKNLQQSEWHSKDKNLQQSEWQSKDKNLQQHWHSKDKNLQQSEWHSKDKNLQQSEWQSKDPSAPHIVHMAGGRREGHHPLTGRYADQRNTYSTAMYVENEMPFPAVRARRWNQHGKLV